MQQNISYLQNHGLEVTDMKNQEVLGKISYGVPDHHGSHGINRIGAIF